MGCGLGVVRVALVCAALVGGALGAGVARADDAPPPGTTGPAATTTAPAPAPCVAAGVLAILPPDATPVLPDPAVAAAAQTGTEVATAAYPDDGSILKSAAAKAGAGGCTGAGAAPGGTAVSAQALSLLGGAVTADSLQADLVPAPGDGSGWHLRASVEGLRVGGQAVAPKRGTPIPVGDWATLRVASRHTGEGALRWWAAAFELDLTRAHAGLAAGTVLLVGYANADAAYAPLPALPARRLQHHARRIARPRTHPQRAHRKHRKKRHKPKVHRPLKATPSLRGGPYVFPVFGVRAAYDSYGGPRSDVSGGWHHGDDIFAPLGTPVLAVANGTVYSVGWNPIGGWRLWLRDKRGDTFYYAHLSGYTHLARDGTKVKAGQMLAFLGHTGDAFTTPTHLHFEIHPARFQRLGYDGAVDPTTYLNAWRHRRVKPKLAPRGLPAGAGRLGEGALSDYRQLLALRAPPRKDGPRRRLARSTAPVVAAAVGPHVASVAPRLRRPHGSTSAITLAGIAAAVIAAVSSLVLLRRRRES